MLFLCEHIGKKLGDGYITKYGKATTIRSACFRCTDNYLEKQYTRHIINTVSLDERITEETQNEFSDNKKRLSFIPYNFDLTKNLKYKSFIEEDIPPIGNISILLNAPK